jgi:predicted nucleic acid-binding protein
VGRDAGTPGSRLILDSGAVIAWSRGDNRLRAMLREAIAQNVELRVPVVVLAETLRGGPRDAPVNRVLKATGTAPTNATTGRRAGMLLGRTGGRNAADALVAAESLTVAGSVVVTSDPDDLGALLADTDTNVVRV